MRECITSKNDSEVLLSEPEVGPVFSVFDVFRASILVAGSGFHKISYACIATIHFPLSLGSSTRLVTSTTTRCGAMRP